MQEHLLLISTGNSPTGPAVGDTFVPSEGNSKYKYVVTRKEWSGTQTTWVVKYWGKLA